MGIQDLANSLNKGAEMTEAQQADAQLKAIIKKQPGYQSLTGTNEYQNLSNLANSSGDLPQYALLKQQAEAAAAAGNTKLAEQLNDELQTQAISGAGAQSNAYSDLSMGGGLSSGARERIAAGGAENQLFAAQKSRLQNNCAVNDIGTNLQSGLLDLGAKSASEKLGLQGSLLTTRGNDLASQNEFNQARHNKAIEVAAAKAKSIREGSAAADAARAGKGSVICTKLHSMGLIEHEVFIADGEYGRVLLRQDPNTFLGYLAWAVYLVALMDKLPLFARIVAPIFIPCAKQIAFNYDHSIGRETFFGKCLLSFMLNFSRCVGHLTNARKRSY